jgi:hypothetical protein
MWSFVSWHSFAPAAIVAVTGKGCLYIKNLSDVNRKVLEELIIGSVAQKARQTQA